MFSARKTVKALLSALPDNGMTIKRAARSILVEKELLVVKASRYLSSMTLPDPQTIYWIDPSRIQYHTQLETKSDDWEDWVFPQHKKVNLVQDGNWDEPAYRVSDMRICRAVQDRTNGVSWPTTDYYKTAVKQIAAGRPLWGCANRSDFDMKCEAIDKLIDSISANGYIPASANPSGANVDSPFGHGEILVNIGRNGAPLFQDGRHRLAVARAMGLNKVPVQIYVRHTGWQEFREFMHRMARSSGGASKKGCLYQNPVHFDLSDIPFEHPCEDRWNAISMHLLGGGGRALDIGCNLGFFGHRLEELGYDCVGVEYLEDVAHAARKIATAEGRRFSLVLGDVLDEEIQNELMNSPFDVVLAVNIFHHFVKTECGYNRLRRLMKRLRPRVMFFEPHDPDDPQMRNVFANPSPQEFAELMCSWGGFQKATEIYRASDRRLLFKLERSD